MKVLLIVLLFFFLLISCSKPNCNKDEQVIFETEYDGLLHTDKLFLFDNRTFRIDMSDFSSCGNYSMKEDTIELEHINAESNQYIAFVISDGMVLELERRNKKWVKSERDSFMGIIRNQLY